MVKLADGASFRFYRLASDFSSIASVAFISTPIAQQIEQSQILLFFQPFKTIVPPVFVQNVAVFFVVDSSNVGWLYFYTFTNITMEFTNSQKILVDASVATGW
jgi:hypothetical protein